MSYQHLFGAIGTTPHTNIGPAHRGGVQISALVPI